MLFPAGADSSPNRRDTVGANSCPTRKDGVYYLGVRTVSRTSWYIVVRVTCLFFVIVVCASTPSCMHVMIEAG